MAINSNMVSILCECWQRRQQYDGGYEHEDGVWLQRWLTTMKKNTTIITEKTPTTIMMANDSFCWGSTTIDKKKEKEKHEEKEEGFDMLIDMPCADTRTTAML